MARIIEIETNDDFKSCDDCVYSSDSGTICKMRGCTHAILDDDIKECYRPKEKRGKRMTKQEETDKIMEIINKCVEEGIIKDFDNIKIALLTDIAKSLSIIADNMQNLGVKNGND